MKIIVATDFSEAADNAVNYVHAVFNLGDLGIQPHYALVHAFKPMTPYSNTPSIPVMKNDALEKVLKEKLEKLYNELSQKLGKADLVEQFFERGSLNEVLKKVAHDTHAQLIVIGSREKGAFTRMTVGSNTMEVANTVDCPVLAIPARNEFRQLKRITLATSLKGQALSKRSIELLTQLTATAKVKLEVLHIFDRDESNNMEDKMKSSVLHHQLSGLAHSHRHLLGQDVSDEISKYVSDAQPDIIAMAPSEKSFFDKIFHQSKTEQMIYSEGLPTLILT
jgi:nucleotide-binding universal stress UspA family protein